MINNTKRIKSLFTDLVGVIRAVEIPYYEEVKEYKTIIDASSVYGFEEIHKSDLELRLPSDHLRELPWNKNVLAGIALIYYPNGGRYIKDPRLISEKTEEKIHEEGYTIKVGVEMEFFLFRSLSVDVKLDKQILDIDAPELQYKAGYIPPRKGYHIVEPMDEVSDIRYKIIEAIHSIGYKISKSHHEVATAGQVEVTSSLHNLVEATDFVIWFKYIAKAIAGLNGHKAIFLPKPLPGDNGSGMHIHLSLWRNNKNLLYDPDDKYRLSQLARYFIGGILYHGRSLSALVSPTVNSYRRLIPGYEAPTILAWGIGNRSIAVRVPNIYVEKNFRVEYRPPDPLANPYLAIPALVLAGLDGIKKKIEPGDPFQDNAYKYTEKQLEEMGYKQLPRNLDEALDELENDNEYLKPVFPKELLETYIEIKRREARQLQAIPTPSEYQYYLYW